MRTKEINVSILKAYDWFCPNCKKHNIKYSELNRTSKKLRCSKCDMKIEHLISFHSDIEIYKEEL